MSAVLTSTDSASLRVKFEENQITFVLQVGKRLSASEEFLLYCLRCIEQSLGNLVGYEMPLRFDTTRALSKHYEDMSKRVCEVCEALELLFPELNERLPHKLHSGLNTRHSVFEAFTSVRDVIFQDSVSWEKIMALFSFTGALVVECLQQGNVEFVVNMLYSVKIFADSELLGWIRQHDGWVGMAKQFESLEIKHSCEPPTRKGYMSLFRNVLLRDLFQSTSNLALLLHEALFTSKYFVSTADYWEKVKSGSKGLRTR